MSLVRNVKLGSIIMYIILPTHLVFIQIPPFNNVEKMIGMEFLYLLKSYQSKHSFYISFSLPFSYTCIQRKPGTSSKRVVWTWKKVPIIFHYSNRNASYVFLNIFEHIFNGLYSCNNYSGCIFQYVRIMCILVS